MSFILKVEGVSKAFGGLIASDNISFEVESGEIKGLIGPNGAGKTTLLNLISGIYKNDNGKIYFGDTDITNVPSYDRARLGLARTFQSPRFLMRSSIRDNLLLGTDLGDQIGFLKEFFGKKGSNFEAELDRLMEIAGFTFKWDADISGIPYGQRKILEIIRALLSHPKVILVDEPAAGLNSKEIENVVAMLHYAAGEGIGVVLIEHMMDMVMNVCNNIVVLNFGKMIAHGSPKEVSSNHAVIEAYLGRGKNSA